MAKKFLDQTGLSYLWGKCVAAFAPKTHTHNYAGAGSSGGIAYHSHDLYIKDIGNMTGKTVAQLRTALDAWLNGNPGYMAMCRFAISDNWIALWGANDTTTTLSTGSHWYATKIGGYTNGSYCQLLISTYYDGIVYTVAKTNGTWQPLRRLANDTHSHAWSAITDKPSVFYTHPTYATKASGLYKITVDATGHISAATAVTKSDITALGIPGQDTNTVYTHPTTSGNKHIPSGGASGQILRWSADGTAVWGSDNNTTYSAFKAATSSAAGGTGLVPAPAAGKQTSFLRGDGTWVVPTNTTYGVATTSANGLMSTAMVTKLNGIATGANKTVVDSALSSTSTNPVQNKIVKAGIDAVSTDVESALDDLLGVGTVQALETLLG
jgi:hypothetical protein|nr:MAG TPA: hypothetical protein [Herelleviridae sp.]